jgi:indole-3-glycerol phosphate synthase
MATYLDEIVAWHRQRAQRDARPLDELFGEARQCGPTRSILPALSRPELSVIAEVKRHSPSKGPLDDALDPVALATAYQAGGAAAISVLTDETFFHGSLEDLSTVRSAVEVPLLRKDFTVDPRDVCDARIAGADLILLICAALDDDELGELAATASELHLDVLFEVHDEAELDRVLGFDPTIVGVNQRDLRTFEVDGARARRLVQSMPPQIYAIAESGLSSIHDAALLGEVGFDGVLVGEHFVRSRHPSSSVAEFASIPVNPRRTVVGS